MTTLDERYQKGLEIRSKFGGGTPRPGWASESGELAPDLYRIIEEALFGSSPRAVFGSAEASTPGGNSPLRWAPSSRIAPLAWTNGWPLSG